MSVIEAAAAGFKDMADGTVRFFFDVEPRHAGAALELFRLRGTPAALAALQVGYAAVQEDKPKGGPLSREAALLCKNPAFLQWLERDECIDSATEELAAEWIRQECSISSRADLDSQDGAAAHFINHIRMPFMRAQRKT